MRLRLTFWFLLLVAGFALLATARHAPAQSAAPRVVYVATIDGMVDLGQATYLQRVLNEATRAGAAAVVLDINTLGGRVDGAIQIRDALLNTNLRTIAFVNKRAISAGALIALATHTIIMAPGGTLGAATPVQVSGAGGGALPVEEKTVSYVRKEFRATAEARGRPPLVAEAMVDADVEIPGLIAKGKLLTLTTEEAMRAKVADYRADTLDDALRQAGLEGAQLRRIEPGAAENLVRVLTHPLVSSLLVTMALVGIVVEMRTPGLQLPGLVGMASLGLVLWGHWLANLAGMEDAALVLAGIVLLAIEIFVIPGFGLAGALGIAAVVGGLVMAMTGAGNTSTLLVMVAGRLVLALLVALALSLVLLRFITRLPGGRKLVLQTELTAGQGFSSAPPEDAHWLGRRGVAHSVLRPAGIAEIDGHRVDVVSDGELVEAGTPIEVTRVDGNRIVVHPIETESTTTRSGR